MKPVAGFLRANRLDPAHLDVHAICRAYVEEMERGLAGRPSSLPMIPTYIETSRPLARGRRVIALDAGGTNLRVAAVSFDASGTPVVEGLTRGRMPGVESAVTKEEFFRTLADAVRPHLADSDRIGFCFSYPAEITREKDGRLIQFTKEIKAPEVEGQLVGSGLLEALGASGRAGVVLLNDTVATLLAGRNAVPGRRFDDFIGLVCGTGFNAAYVERNASIARISMGDEGSMVVNTESGSFARGARGAVDDAFDATMNNPGRYRFEKTISGAYLGALCRFAAESAARAGVLSAEAGRAIQQAAAFSTRDLNDFLLYPDRTDHPFGAAVAGRDGDARALYQLCDTIVERAAAMVAVNLAGVVLKSGRGRDPRYPVCITVDGTTFWQLRTFRFRVESWMRRLLSGSSERAWEITSVEDAPLLGAAIAALTN